MIITKLKMKILEEKKTQTGENLYCFGRRHRRDSSYARVFNFDTNTRQNANKRRVFFSLRGIRTLIFFYFAVAFCACGPVFDSFPPIFCNTQKVINITPCPSIAELSLLFILSQSHYKYFRVHFCIFFLFVCLLLLWKSYLFSGSLSNGLLIAKSILRWRWGFGAA